MLRELVGLLPFVPFMVTSATIKRLAFSAGFDLCGIAKPAVIPKARAAYERWLVAGYHGDMAYLAKDPQRRTDPTQVMEGACSIIMLGLNCYQTNSEQVPPGHGRVARYARGKDYHKVAARKIKTLIRTIEEAAGEAGWPQCRWFVDFGPVRERVYAEKAGLGFIGKNGMLTNKDFGSWILLCEIITTLELEPDECNPTVHGRCGSCRKCIEACPTGAILSPRKIDSRRCLSYLTIERPSEIPDELAMCMGDLVFGCDICQEVCPYNRMPVVTTHAEFKPENGVGEFLDLDKIISLQSPEEFLALTSGTPLTRPGLDGLKRSAEIVLRNQSSRKQDTQE